MGVRTLWKAPEVDPVSRKALSVPVLNPFDKYGRTFYFSTFGFMIAFLSWYAFPPLLTVTVKKDLHMSQNEIANSNIVALTATLLVRLIVGPLCDRYGPRLVFAGILLSGSIPTALAGTVTTPTGLIVLRFFIGILGGSFVPCQVWSTGFYDKSVVGTANALMAGIGNGGGGITYFVMPAIFDSLVHKQGLTPHVAWRVAFIVPFILVITMALGMLFLGEDTPTGPWSERLLHTQENIEKTHSHAYGAGIPVSHSDSYIIQDEKSDEKDVKDIEAKAVADSTDSSIIGEVIQKPTVHELVHVIISLQTITLALQYACSFGGELAINSILGSYYKKSFPEMTQTASGRWAAMFGLLNIPFRPIGGIVSDLVYHRFHSVWAKKIWLTTCGIFMGVFCLAIGFSHHGTPGSLIGMVAGLAFFVAASNGANYSVVPHVHPYANGIVSGVVGASGNMGGIIFAIIFRYSGVHYGRAIWIIGTIVIGVNAAVSWIRPLPGQAGR